MKSVWDYQDQLVGYILHNEKLPYNKNQKKIARECKKAVLHSTESNGHLYLLIKSYAKKVYLEDYLEKIVFEAEGKEIEVLKKTDFCYLLVWNDNETDFINKKLLIDCCAKTLFHDGENRKAFIAKVNELN